MTKKAAAIPIMEWQTDIRLMTHPLMLANFAKMLGITWFVVSALLSFLMAVTGSPDAILPLVGAMTLVCLGIAVLFALVALVFFGNRIRMHFRVDAKYADAKMADARASAANKVAVVAGVLTGRPGVTGAGLLAASNSEQRIAWNAVAKVRYHKAWNAITLGNSWRTMVTLFCTAENYEAVAAAVAKAMEARPALAKAVRKSPLPRLLLYTLLTVAACIPLFLLPDLDENALFPALLVLAFALTALWLVPVFGWAVFAGLGWLVLLEVMEQNRLHDSFLGRGQFSGWDVLSADDQAGLVLAALGAAYLIWQSLGLLHGRIRSALAGDMAEAGGS